MPSKIDQSVQEIVNQGFDVTYGVPASLGLGEDGSGSLQRAVAQSLAMKITVSGDITYIAQAAPGTAESEAKWQVKKIDASAGVVFTWADGNSNFDNVATDLTALTYE